MAFADMFAPMRNFGSTAAATTQANAALMGAEAAQSRAKTAERLAPWNMGATAVQGIGTIGGLTQKFMEMEQMRPQREAMTGYYEALTQEKNDPANQLTKSFTAASTISKFVNDNYYSKGLQPPPEVIRSLKGQIWNSFGARAAPQPAPGVPSAGGGFVPIQSVTPGAIPTVVPGAVPSAQYVFPADMDPALAESSRNMAEIMTSAVTAGPTPERLKKVRDIAELAQNAVLRKLKSEEEFANTVGNDGILWLKKIAAFSEATKAATGAGLMANPDAPWFAGISRLLTESGMSEQDSTRLMTQVFGPEAPQVIKNLRLLATPRPLAGTMSQVSFEEGQKMKSRLGGDLSGAPEGTAGSEVAAARLAPLGSETPRQRDLQGFSEVELEQRVPHGQAGSVAASRLLDSLGNKNPSSETLTATTRLLGGVLRDLPEKLAGLAQDEITYAFDEGSSPEMNRTLSMLTRAAHSVAPEYRDDLWRIIINKAAGELPAAAGGREAGLRTGYELKEIGRDAAGEPIYDVPSAEEYVGTPRVDRRTRIVNALEKAKRHFSTVEYDQGPGGVADWLGGGGGGASASEGEAIEGLLREMVSSANRPEGAEIADRLSNSQLRDLLNVGELRGPISGHTQYRKTYKPMWNIAETGYADIDEGRAGPGQYAQEALWWLMGAGLGANALGQFGPTIGAATQALPFLEPVGRGLGITRERYGD